MKFLRNQIDLTLALKGAAELDPQLGDALKVIKRVPLRKRVQGFQTLLQAIVGQQISVSAASAIWRRLETDKLTSIRNVAKATDEKLAACGLSKPKIRYAKALASARINYRSLPELSTETVVEKLTEVPGIGRWTAEIYALFALGHPDAFPAGDLALQESVRLLYELEARPSEKELREFSGRWQLYRGAVARLLWEYYSVRKRPLA